MSEDEQHGLVMPFVVVASHGGPYDDEAFVAGWECGSLDMALRVLAPTGAVLRRWVKPALIEQLDLIAMKHGRALYLGDIDDSGEWRYVEIDIPGRPEDAS